MKVLGLLYGQCMAGNGGTPPASQEEFVAFMQREPANWDKLAPSPEKFLAEARSGVPLVVRYGSEAQPPADGGLPWIAYEQPSDGAKALMVNIRGSVQEADAQQVQQLVGGS
jgi:hypothetical protein